MEQIHEPSCSHNILKLLNVMLLSPFSDFIIFFFFLTFYASLPYLFPSSVALMNHSCSPNVIVTYKGTVAEVRAVKEINPGEEVRKQVSFSNKMLKAILRPNTITEKKIFITVLC